MNKSLETIFTFIFLTIFSLATIYPVLNIISVSLRTDNAFLTLSLSLIEIREEFNDTNNNGMWDENEIFMDKNVIATIFKTYFI